MSNLFMQNSLQRTVYNYLNEAKSETAPRLLEEYASEHGTPAQRAYNLLCMAYGADAKLFRDVVSKGYLPKDRAEFCDEEYEQVQHAFDELIAPHIDHALTENIMDRTWLRQR